MSVPLCEVTKTGMSVDDGVEQPRSSMSLAETWAKRQWPTPPVGFIQSSDAVVVTSSVPADLGAVPSASAYDQGHVRFARDLMEQHAQMQMLVHEFVSQGMAFMQSHRQKLEQVTLKHRELAHQGTNTGHIPSTEKLHARTGDDVEHNPCPLASVVVKNDSASVCDFAHGELSVGDIGHTVSFRPHHNPPEKSQSTSKSGYESTESIQSKNSLSSSVSAVTSSIRVFRNIVSLRLPFTGRDSEVSRERHETRQAYHHMLSTLPESKSNVLSRTMSRVEEGARKLHNKRRATWRGRLRLCLRSTCFQIFISAAILVQGSIIAASSNAAATLAYQKWDGESRFTIEATEHLLQQLQTMDMCITAIFFVELASRLLCDGSLFFISKDWKWNVLDFILVLSAVIELALFASTAVVDVSFFRLLRILRAFRTLRLFRMFRVLSGLRLMVDAIFSSLLPLIWTSLFLAILIFVFAVMLQFGVTNHLLTATANESLLVEQLRTHFENLAHTMLTLFMSIAGGLSWAEVVSLLLEFERPWFGLLFVVYIGVMFIFVLNIITGVLVNNVVESARQESEQEQERKSRYLRDIRGLWRQMDENNQGFLTRQEFNKALTTPHIQEQFERLNAELTDCATFFESLDHDGDGTVELEEFVVGLMRVTFKSNMVDSQTLLRENRKAKRQASKLAHDTQTHLLNISRVLTEIEKDQRSFFGMILAGDHLNGVDCPE